MKLTEQQKQISPSQDFWENMERSKVYQESLPPATLEQVIKEMKARGQYKPGKVF